MDVSKGMVTGSEKKIFPLLGYRRRNETAKAWVTCEVLPKGSLHSLPAVCSSLLRSFLSPEIICLVDAAILVGVKYILWF